MGEISLTDGNWTYILLADSLPQAFWTYKTGTTTHPLEISSPTHRTISTWID